jgi:cytoskeletal protein CcmA (bactofilin family)
MIPQPRIFRRKVSNKIFKRLLLAFVSLLILIGLTVATPLQGMESRSGEQVFIPSDEVVEDDLYVAGETITIDGTVSGDLVAAGRVITLNGTVEGDMIAAGQAIAINGTVTDDVRMAGQVLKISAGSQIDDDVIAAGASLESEEGSAIAGTLSFMGAQSLIAGTVGEMMRGTMAALEVRGNIGEDVNVIVGAAGETFSIEPPFTPPSPISVPSLTTGLTVTESAQIGGALNYRSPSEATISPAAEINEGVSATLIEIDDTVSPAVLIWNRIQRWITLLIIGVLLLWLLPGWTQQLTAIIQSQPLPSLGWGIVLSLLIAVVAIAITSITIFLTALFGTFLWNLAPFILGTGFLANTTLITGFMLFIGYVPAIALSYLGGQRLFRQSDPLQFPRGIAPLSVGLLIFVLLTSIPILGGIIAIITTLLGLGALWIWGQRKLKPVGDRSLLTSSD